jgi:NADH-ubiquinone oxidoreductase chain 2
VQTRIKRLYAYSTISHVGFILLGLSINSVESIQAYIFYIIAYTISNLNAFLILLAIGYSLYAYVNMHDDYSRNIVKGSAAENDKYNSPIQLISELKGYYYINPFLAVSLSITLFSFVGVPPLFGFFAKQMILSAALDSGYYFITLIAILTSVIGAVYYLSLIKQIFFFKSDYVFSIKHEITPYLRKLKATLNNNDTSLTLKSQNIIGISGALSLMISFITLILLGFIFTPNE